MLIPLLCYNINSSPLGSVMSGSGDDYILTLRPPPGVIEGFEGQENIEICCEIYRDMRITPRWSLITAEDYKLGLDPVIINPDNDTRFIFELGDPEELEIEVLIPELDGAIISCHETATEEMEVVGSWTLSSFRESCRVESSNLNKCNIRKTAWMPKSVLIL